MRINLTKMILGDKEIGFAETDKMKIVRSPDYNYNFYKETGFFMRWGKDLEDDPDFAPAPEILDIEISTICHMGCSFCSPAGTKINTVDGEKNIEDIQEGDFIISQDLDENKRHIDKVKETYKRQYFGKIIDIELKNGKILSLTPDHSIFTNRGWIPAYKLTEDDELLDLE